MTAPKYKIGEPYHYCECGCGEITTKNRNYKLGHYMRVKPKNNLYIDNNDGSTTLILSNNTHSLIDTEDIEKLELHAWHENKSRSNNTSYAYASGLRDSNGKQTKFKLHRYILDFPDYIVDHIDNNGLNNCKSNLRPSNHILNRANGPGCSSSSQYKGVIPTPHGTYRACIGSNGQYIWLGTFKTEIEAAKVYDQKAYKLWGEHAFLNFSRKIIDA